MEVAVQTVANVANSDDEGATSAATSNVSADVYAFDNYSAITDSLTGRTGYNAHTYYNKVKGLPITGGNAAISTSDPLAVRQIGGSATAAWTLLTANPANIYKVTVTLFLNGWDLACFDAVQGQTVTIGFKFSTTSGTTVKVADAA